MKVYELIQELAKYDANTEVHFHVVASYTDDVNVFVYDTFTQCIHHF